MSGAHSFFYGSWEILARGDNRFDRVIFEIGFEIIEPVGYDAGPTCPTCPPGQTGAPLMMCSLMLFAVLIKSVDEEQVFSGPQAGEKLTPFIVYGVLGKHADQKIDLTAHADRLPCVIVFVHERTRPAYGLAQTVMKLVADRGPRKVTGGAVFLSEDPTQAATQVARLPKYFPGSVVLGVSPDGKEGPGAYGLNRNVSVTVLVAKKGVVTANFALVQPDIGVDGAKIFKAIGEVLGEEKSPLIADFAPERYRGPAKKKMTRETPARPQDPELRRLLTPMIQKTATDDQVIAAAAKVEAYAAKNRKARTEIGQIAKRIIDGGTLKKYGTAKTQEYLRKWAVEYAAKSPEPSNRGAVKRDAKD
ncbi:MAG: hypothetical protein ABGZ24_13205 [Fuerstiella sp.]